MSKQEQVAQPRQETFTDGSIGWNVVLFAGETIAAVIAVSGGRRVALNLAKSINAAASYVDEGEQTSAAEVAALARAQAFQDMRRAIPRGRDSVDLAGIRDIIARMSDSSIYSKQAD